MAAGSANSMVAKYLHVIINADVEINRSIHRLIHRREPLVESRWGGDVGVPYDPDRFDRWVRHGAVAWDVLRQYGRAVHEGFVESLDDLTERQLVLAVDMTRAGLGRWQGRDLYELHGYGHPHIHGGGIAVLKGLQVGIGWVESEAFRSAANVEDVDE